MKEMVKLKSIYCIAISLLFTLAFLSCEPAERTITFTLDNSSDIDRIEEGITISRKAIEEKLGVITPTEAPYVYGNHDEALPFQLDDLDGDGKWDELFFLASVKAKSIGMYALSIYDKVNIPIGKKRTNIRFAEIKPPHKELTSAKRLGSTDSKISQTYFQMEGPAWENDKVAFRNYFDARNGIDIYGKRVPEMILDKVGINGQNYHELDDWGMDILKVGNSLGAGAIAMESQDSVYRINYSKGADFQLITEGDLRSVFELNFPGFEVNGNKHDIKHQITIQAGSRFYESKVTISNLQQDEKLVAGLVRILNDTIYVEEFGAYSYVATHDKQAYDKEYLGMGLVFKATNLKGITLAPEKGNGIVQSYLMAFDSQNEVPITFRSYACWEFENDKFADVNYFLQYMKKEAVAIATPLVIAFLSEKK